jgi:molecular chaperone Hsp33
MKFRDQLWRFSFEQLDIRGELVYLDESWQQVLARHDYPPNVRNQLGQALAVVALLSVSIKFEGTLIMQIQGKGPLRSLVTQVTSKGAVRGLARWDGMVPDGTLQDVFGGGNILITIIKDSGERYQSIVELSGINLAEALNRYFLQSEQLPSSFQLFVSPEHVAGFFLQALPVSQAQSKSSYSEMADITDREENWNRVNILADTLRSEEIFNLDPARLLHQLFNEEEVHLFDPGDLHFECTCSREKVEKTLIAFGKAELENILEEEGSIKVDCEFCNMHYSFDAVDVAALCDQDTAPPPGATFH